MRIALCISGHLRDYKLCVESPFFQSLKKKGDIFVTTWDFVYPFTSCNTGFLIESPNVNVDEVKSIYQTDNVKMIKTLNFNIPIFDSFDKKNFGRFANFKSMHYLLKQSINFVEESGEYDLVIRLRPDLYLLSEIDVSHNRLTFPACSLIDKEWSCTDIFFKGSLSEMKIISSFYDVIDSYLIAEHIESWHERFFTDYVRKNLKYEIDNDVRFQLLRMKRDQFTVGFYDKNGKTEIPKI